MGKPPAFPEGMQVRLLHAGRVQATRPWRMEAHGHAHHELIIPQQGSLVVNPKSREGGVFEPGQVLLYGAGWSHAESARFEDRFELLYFGFRAGQITGFKSVRDEARRISRLGSWLVEGRDPDLAPDGHAQAFFRAMLAEFWRLASGLGEETLPQKVRKHLQLHFPEAITLEGLSRRFGVSKFHLLRTYAREMGTTPMADLGDIRLKEAQALLRTTRLPLKAIADTVGFSSGPHLSKLFRARLGQAPSRFRED